MTLNKKTKSVRSFLSESVYIKKQLSLKNHPLFNALIIEAVGNSNTSVNVYQTVHIPKDSYLFTRPSREKLSH